MSLGLDKRWLEDEEEIVWLEPIEGLPYVRESFYDTYRTRRGLPGGWGARATRGMADFDRVVGYANLVPDAENSGEPGRFHRRVFYLRTTDFTGAYSVDERFAPGEAVDPTLVRARETGPLLETERESGGALMGRASVAKWLQEELHNLLYRCAEAETHTPSILDVLAGEHYCAPEGQYHNLHCPTCGDIYVHQDESRPGPDGSPRDDEWSFFCECDHRFEITLDYHAGNTWFEVTQSRGGEPTPWEVSRAKEREEMGLEPEPTPEPEQTAEPPPSAFLDCIPQDYRGTCSEMFYRAIREGKKTPEEILASVRAATRKRLRQTFDLNLASCFDDRALAYCGFLDHLDGSPAWAKAYCRLCLEREAEPPEVKAERRAQGAEAGRAERNRNRPVTPAQAACLARNGLPPAANFAEADETISQLVSRKYKNNEY